MIGNCKLFLGYTVATACDVVQLTLGTQNPLVTGKIYHFGTPCINNNLADFSFDETG
jgi:hypothetical protein